MARPERLRRLPRDTNLREWLLGLDPDERRRAIDLLGDAERDALDRDWPTFAHEGQQPPRTCPDGSDWRTWVIMAGRSFGKTASGAHWIVAAVAAGRRLDIALVGATLDDARRVMIEGRSGLLEVAGAWVTEWQPSLRRLRFRTGAVATLFSGASPDQLRGPQHHLAWCDELAKWEKPAETWDMLQLGLRLGDWPRAVVTTTPRPGAHLQAIMAAPGCVVTGGPSSANPHNAPAWLENAEALYAGTRLGRQELEGELLSDAPGALWTEELLERCRPDPPRDGEGDHAQHGGGGSVQVSDPPPPHFVRSPSPSWGGFTRVVIAVDPPSGDGTCGIIACAKDEAGRGHVLADHSVTGRTPEGWARAVADAAQIHSRNPPRDGEGDRRYGGGGGSPCALPVTIVAESNQGGQMVEAVLRTADPDLDVRLVTATRSKAHRAEPVAHLFEAGKVALHGRFPLLEAQLCGMIAGGDYEGPGASPDRADAMVWGLTELLLGPEPIEPRVRRL